VQQERFLCVLRTPLTDLCLCFVRALRLSGAWVMYVRVCVCVCVLRRAQIQQASKAGQKVSIITTFQEKFKAGGWEGVAGFACKVGVCFDGGGVIACACPSPWKQHVPAPSLAPSRGA
jgi:hypothetical protein